MATGIVIGTGITSITGAVTGGVGTAVTGLGSTRGYIHSTTILTAIIPWITMDIRMTTTTTAIPVATRTLMTRTPITTMIRVPLAQLRPATPR